MSSDSSYVAESDERLSSPEPQFPSSPPRPNIAAQHNVNEDLEVAPNTQSIVPSPVDNPFAQGEDAKTYFTRPNRYFGPASTWKSWTEKDRTVALSLDRVRSQDLSIHLFNAFYLKRKTNESAHGKRPKKSRKGKERAASVVSITDDALTSDPEGAGRQSTLPKTWTAWPMPPAQVPKEELLPQPGAGGALHAKSDPRPSANLEGWLIATATKLARERWDSRLWEETKTGTLKPGEVDHRDADLEIDHALDADEPEAEDAAEEEGEEPAFQLFSSRVVSVSDETESKFSARGKQSSDDEEHEVDRQPVPTADDDTTRQYFLPSARHILSTLDHLLLGLHNARHVYAAKPHGRARGRYFSRTPEDQLSTDVEEHDEGPRSASRKRRRSSSANTDTSSSSNGRRRRRDHVERLGLRDWSDVVGMAALTGWNPAVVERASERCARLFGENMLFRTFHEGDAKAGTQSHFTEQLAWDSESSTTSPEADQVEIMSVRTSAPCEACRASRSLCLPAEPRAETSRWCRNCQGAGIDCSGITVQHTTSTTNERTCPIDSCPRHTIPFRKLYHLQRHLDSVHQNDRVNDKLLGRSSTSATASADVSDADTEFAMSFGSTQPIVCPVPGCPRGRRPFPEGRRLYDHVRRMHPQVDVESVKELEVKRRGERRGKWRDERRRRSASARRSSSRNARRRDASTRVYEGNDDDDYRE